MDNGTALLCFKALSDETRLRLVYILLHYELSVNELVHILDMGQSRVSRHLKILTEAGLLGSRRDGLWVFYAAPKTGERHDLLRALMAFVQPDAHMRADLAMAAQMLEERAFQKTRQFFNAIAENWDELNNEVLGDFDLPAAVCAAVPQGCGTAVDLGCGTGAVLARLLPLAHGVIGVDGSARMLEICRRRFAPEDLSAERVSLRIGDLSHLPLRDHEADFACINLVLHHLSQPAEALAKSGGSCSCPAGGCSWRIFCAIPTRPCGNRYGDRWLGFAEDALATVLQKAGFAAHSAVREPVGRA